MVKLAAAHQSLVDWCPMVSVEEEELGREGCVV